MYPSIIINSYSFMLNLIINTSKYDSIFVIKYLNSFNVLHKMIYRRLFTLLQQPRRTPSLNSENVLYLSAEYAGFSKLILESSFTE